MSNGCLDLVVPLDVRLVRECARDLLRVADDRFGLAAATLRTFVLLTTDASAGGLTGTLRSGIGRMVTGVAEAARDTAGGGPAHARPTSAQKQRH